MGVTSDGYTWKPRKLFDLYSNWFTEMFIESKTNPETKVKYDALKKIMAIKGCQEKYFKKIGDGVLRLQRLPKLQLSKYKDLMTSYKALFEVYDDWRLLVRKLTDEDEEEETPQPKEKT